MIDDRSCLVCGYWAPAVGRLCEACVLDRRSRPPRHFGDDDGPAIDAFDWDAFIEQFEDEDA